MQLKTVSRTLAVAFIGFLVAACTDSSAGPTAVARSGNTMSGGMDHSMGGISASLLPADMTPFTYRAAMEPFKIQQLPDFQIHSKVLKDIVFQRSVFNPGAGMWHTHPGPSFIYVLDGAIKLQRYNKEQGCFDTPTYVTGNTYYENADEVHRAVVTSATPAVVLVTRFNIPAGAAITVPAAAPECFQ